MDLKTLLETIDIEIVENYISKVGTIDIDNKNEYIVQINNAIKRTQENISILFTNESDTDKVWDCIACISQAYRQIYFEIGLCAGIKLGHELHNS